MLQQPPENGASIKGEDQRIGAAAVQRRNDRPLIIKLLLLLLASILFTILLVPLYNVFCQVTGFNGKTNNQFLNGGLGLKSSDGKVSQGLGTLSVDQSRVITVEFLSQVMPGVNLDIRPLSNQTDVHPGSMHLMRYLVRNTSEHPVIIRAVPSVSPSQAARNFHKIECFCFNEQYLKAGESKEMPLTFIVKSEIEQDIRNISLSYAFFNVPESEILAKNNI